MVNTNIAVEIKNLKGFIHALIPSTCVCVTSISRIHIIAATRLAMQKKYSAWLRPFNVSKKERMKNYFRNS
jgi:hypothetical protein